MNTILQKRIKEAARECDYQYENEELAFISGGTYALENQWISVEEALPAYNIKVLVCFKPAFGDKQIFITTRKPEGTIVYEKNKFYIEQSGEVIHWMEIPKLNSNE